jgi:Fe-S-cluster containining protein
MSGCDGACCVAFVLSSQGDEMMDGIRPAHTVLDGEKVLDMLTEITPRQARYRRGKFGVGFPAGGDKQRWYRCRHWNERTRLCGIYEERPQMCRDYPGYGEGGKCSFGCDCTDG